MQRDFIDQTMEEWSDQRPDLDPSPIGVVSRLMRITRHLERLLSQTFEPYDLSPTDFDVLAALRRIGPPFELSLATLNEWLLSNNSTMTYRIDRLVKAGLVERRQNPANRRTALIQLTGRGRELVDQVIEMHLDFERELLAGLPAEEREQLAVLLRRFSFSLGDTGSGDTGSGATGSGATGSGATATTPAEPAADSGPS